jgi:intein/homing endonuclease
VFSNPISIPHSTSHSKKIGGKTVDILIFSKNLVEYLVKHVGLKLGPKRNRAESPNWVLHHGLELHALRGLFDTDGCLVFDKQHSVK